MTSEVKITSHNTPVCVHIVDEGVLTEEKVLTPEDGEQTFHVTTTRGIYAQDIEHFVDEERGPDDPFTFDFHQAMRRMERGERVTRLHWKDDGRSLVLVPGRDITVSYEPMKTHLGEGAQMRVHDHIDALFEFAAPRHLCCVVGYQFLQDDLLAEDWTVWTPLVHADPETEDSPLDPA